MPVDIRETSERLRSLADNRPNASLRSEVAEGLASKFEGVQSVAAQTLGSWGDPESIAMLQTRFDTLGDRRSGWAIRGVAIAALARCIPPSEARWALDRFFGADGDDRYRFRPLIQALPWGSLRGRVARAASSPDRTERHSAFLAIVWARPPELEVLLGRLAEDPDPEIRRWARHHMNRPGPSPCEEEAT